VCSVVLNVQGEQTSTMLHAYSALAKHNKIDPLPNPGTNRYGVQFVCTNPGSTVLQGQNIASDYQCTDLSNNPCQTYWAKLDSEPF
jgi:hypothetical protein